MTFSSIFGVFSADPEKTLFKPFVRCETPETLVNGVLGLGRNPRLERVTEQQDSKGVPQFASLYVGDLHPDVTEAVYVI